MNFDLLFWIWYFGICLIIGPSLLTAILFSYFEPKCMSACVLCCVTYQSHQDSIGVCRNFAHRISCKMCAWLCVYWMCMWLCSLSPETHESTSQSYALMNEKYLLSNPLVTQVNSQTLQIMNSSSMFYKPPATLDCLWTLNILDLFCMNVYFVDQYKFNQCCKIYIKYTQLEKFYMKIFFFNQKPLHNFSVTQYIHHALNAAMADWFVD